MLVAASGTIVEWFDYSLFFYLATALSASFYPGQSASVAYVFATGAVGFLFRPLGAVVFGHIGDTRGRTVSLVASAGLRAIAMLGIALIPGYDTIGMWGAIGVLALRALAGFSVGAEYTGIMVYLMETADPRRRGYVASYAAANSEVGALLAVGSAAVTTWLVGTENLNEWGWRIPFILGAILSALMIPLRKLMVESPAMEHLKDAEASPTSAEAQSAGTPKASPGAEKTPLMVALKQQPRAIWISFLISTVGSATYFLTITYLPTYFETVNHQSSQQALNFGVVAAVAAIVVTPLFGLLSDAVGRKKAFSVLLVAVLALAVPGYALLSAAYMSLVLLAVVMLAAPAAGWSAVAAAAVPEQFDTQGRYTGMAVGYNMAAVIFGGFTPPLVAWMVQATGNALTPAYYASAIALAAGIPAIWLMRNHTNTARGAHMPAS